MIKASDIPDVRSLYKLQEEEIRRVNTECFALLREACNAMHQAQLRMSGIERQPVSGTRAAFGCRTHVLDGLVNFTPVMDVAKTTTAQEWAKIHAEVSAFVEDIIDQCTTYATKEAARVEKEIQLLRTVGNDAIHTATLAEIDREAEAAAAPVPRRFSAYNCGRTDCGDPNCNLGESVDPDEKKP